jgi:hypothetical protein
MEKDEASLKVDGHCMPELVNDNTFTSSDENSIYQ